MKALKCDAKGMRTLDTFFKSTEASTSMSSSRSSRSSQPFPESINISIPPKITKNSLIPIETKTNLQIRLEEINQQCSISKSVKTNKNIFTYDYLRCLSIRRYIQLLLDGQGKMDASN